jgi:hypothetical protein
MWPDFPFVPSDSIRRREDFGVLLNLRGLTGTLVEIGTDRGEFAAQLLRQWEGEKLVCVDPWQDNLPGYEDVVNTRPREPDYRKACRRLGPYGDRVQIIRALEVIAAEQFARESLDGIYYDANHEAGAFKDALLRWTWRVRSGGLVAGHDFTGDWAGETKRVLFDLLLIWRQPIFYLLGEAGSWFTFKP